MGAAVALLTPPHPYVAAIIVDSPYAHSNEVIRRYIHWHLMLAASTKPSLRRMRSAFPALAWATVATSTIIFRIRFGHSMVARPAASFKRWNARSKSAPRPDFVPILLIHDEKDPLIPITHAHQIVARARTYNIPLETYFVDHSVHCGAYGYNPERYITVIQEFLSRHLGDDFPRASGA
jgi:pimeloyl-ACP methyl ester carboxylesterase